MDLVSDSPETIKVLFWMEAYAKFIDYGTFGVGEVHDCVIISEEVDLVDAQLLGIHLLDDVLYDLIISALFILHWLLLGV
jgi:hypothetical protein